MWLRTCAFLACFTLGGTSAASAACRQADLTGWWDLYTVWGRTEAAWTACALQIAANGTIGSGSRCTDGYNRPSSVTGRLTVQSLCRVTGQATQRLGGQFVQNHIPQATLTRDKELLAGVGRAPGVGLFLFQAVKR